MLDWIVRMATPEVEGYFEVEIPADSEVAAVAMALAEYPFAYVVYSRRAS